jgi:hypothetical protein
MYLVDEVSDGTGLAVCRQTLILQVPGDGRLTTEGGWTYEVPPLRCWMIRRFELALGTPASGIVEAALQLLGVPEDGVFPAPS